MDSPRRQEALLLLGLVDPVTERQVTQAYREVAKRVHPDAVDSSQADPDRFAAVHDAYEFLLTAPAPSPTRPQPGPVRVFGQGASARPGDWIIVGPARVRPADRARRRP